MARHFLPVSKTESCTNTPQGRHLCQISWKISCQTKEVVHRRKIFPMVARIMPLPWSTHCTIKTVRKWVLQVYTPRQTSVTNGHENWSKTEDQKLVDARFFPHFCHNMPLASGDNLSVTVEIMCHEHQHSMANISAKSYIMIAHKLSY